MENIDNMAILMYEKTYWNTNPSRSPIQERLPAFKTVGQDLRQNFYLVQTGPFPTSPGNRIKCPLWAKARGMSFKGSGAKKSLSTKICWSGNFP